MYFALFISMLFWGGSWVNMKLLVSLDSALNIGFARFILATLATAPLLIMLKIPFKTAFKDLFIAGVCALLLVLYTWLFYQALIYGKASIGGALVTPLIPIFTFILMIILRKKRAFIKDIFALILGVIGVGVVLNIWDFSADNLLAPQNGYYIACAFVWSAITIISVKSSAHPLTFSFYLYLFSGAICAIFFTDFKTLAPLHLSGDGAIKYWLNLSLMSFGAMVFANAFYFAAANKLGASEAASFSFLVPFCAIFFSWIFLGEALLLTTIIGVVLTLLAVKTINNISFKKAK